MSTLAAALSLLAAAHSAPPNIAADAILKILAAESQVPEGKRKIQLADAWVFAGQASLPIGSRSIPGEQVESGRNTNASAQRETGIDGLTLQCRVVEQQHKMNPKLARELFLQIDVKNRATIANCGDPIPNAGSYFELFEKLYANDREVAEHAVNQITGPSLAYAVAMLKTPDVAALTERLRQISPDPYATSVTAFSAATINKLLPMKPSAQLRDAYRSFALLTAGVPQCALRGVKAPGTVIADALSALQVAPADPDLLASIKSIPMPSSPGFFDTPNGREILGVMRHLNPDTNTPPAQRRLEFGDAVNKVLAWRESEQESAIDAFAGKSYSFDNLAKLATADEAKSLVENAALTTIVEAVNDQRIPHALWLAQLRKLLKRLSPAALERWSGASAAIELQVKLQALKN